MAQDGIDRPGEGAEENQKITARGGQLENFPAKSAARNHQQRPGEAADQPRNLYRAEPLLEQDGGQDGGLAGDDPDEPAGVDGRRHCQTGGLEHMMGEDANEAHEGEDGPGVARRQQRTAAQVDNYGQDQGANREPGEEKSHG